MTQKNIKILIAEDDEYSAVLLKEWLTSRNVNLHIVTNGRDAVDYCNSNPVDIVLMDIKLPIINGIEAAKQIRLKKPDIIIIAQSACVNNYEVPNAYFDAYILKPLIREKLLKLILKLSDANRM